MRMALLLLLVLAPPAAADVTLHGLFGDHMVLQRDAKVPVWGRADPGERVKVIFAGQTRIATADDHGRWRVELAPLGATAGRKLVVTARNRITLKNVCVGDVWICSGQSNMAWPLRAAANAEEEIRRSKDPRLRLFTVPHRVSGEPLADVTGRWVAAGRDTVPSFSAVAFFFGAELREAQALALHEPRTGMAVAIDIGAAGNIHPKNKQEVGRRLALAARSVAYGETEVVTSGPRLARCAFEGAFVVAEFDQEIVTFDKGPPKGFAVAGRDRTFHWAAAQVEGRRVTLSCPAVPEPVALRYAWADNPECNVVNRPGLPAPPFRTDDWPGVTAGKR